MTHLGQRLSALIDGELDGTERDRVLIHMARCTSCRDEVAALRMLKRRMNALGQAAAEAGLAGPAGAGLTGKLMGLRDSVLTGRTPMAEAAWPPPAPAGGWPVPADTRPEHRAGKYFLAGSLVVFLAGLGTAAFIAGGEAQTQAPSAPVTPSVDVLVVPHAVMSVPDTRRTGTERHALPVPATTMASRLP